MKLDGLLSNLGEQEYVHADSMTLSYLFAWLIRSLKSRRTRVYAC